MGAFRTRMAYILSVIADPATPAIGSSLVDALFSSVKAGDTTTLAQGLAWEAPLSASFELDDLRRQAGDAPLDINIIPAESRRKKLLIADMDSTIIQQECIDELAEYAGKRAEISDITEQAMRGELDFEEALKARVGMLNDLPETVLAQTFAERITLTPGARTLVQTMNAMGAVTALISGGFTFFTERVAEAAGFQQHQANKLFVQDGRLTGSVAEPILGREAKREALIRIAGQKGISAEETLAVGDGANDLSMLGEASLGVAFHAKPAVAAAAHARIDHGDLTALLYLQGIPQDEFKT